MKKSKFNKILNQLARDAKTPPEGCCCIDLVSRPGVTREDCGRKGGVWLTGVRCEDKPCEKSPNNTEHRGLFEATGPCQGYVTQTDSWIDNNPNCGSGGTIALRGHRINQQGEMIPLMDDLQHGQDGSGSHPFHVLRVHTDPGDKVLVQLKHLNPTSTAGFGELLLTMDSLWPSILSSIRVNGHAVRNESGYDALFKYNLGTIEPNGNINIEFELPANDLTIPIEMTIEDLSDEDSGGPHGLYCLNKGFYSFSVSGYADGGTSCPEAPPEGSPVACHKCRRGKLEVQFFHI
ncbi:MAG: hypothetical protein QF569_23485 [Candidatus Poribacteria bacterium]|nr:hypothetical protein [Candidatus Poribacteria bacterium]